LTGPIELTNVKISDVYILHMYIYILYISWKIIYNKHGQRFDDAHSLNIIMVAYSSTRIVGLEIQAIGPSPYQPMETQKLIVRLLVGSNGELYYDT